MLATAVRSQPLQVASGQLGLCTWQLGNQDLTLGPPFVQGVIGMKIGGKMMQTGLQSLFVLLLVLVQYVAGQDLAGVLSALQGQAGEVLVKGDSVGLRVRFVQDENHTDWNITPPSPPRKYAESNSAEHTFRKVDVTNWFQDYESRRLVMNAACTDEPAVIGDNCLSVILLS